VIACICAWLGVVLIIVALVTSHWLEADGFYQGLWKYCFSDKGVEICSSAAYKGVPVRCTGLGLIKMSTFKRDRKL